MANKKLDALVFSSTKNKNEIVQATITTLNSKENKNPGNKYLAQVSHIHTDGENAGKQYFVISDGLKTEKSLSSNLLDINVGLSTEQVQALIAQAQLNGANIDQEVLKNLIAQELAKNPTTGITEQRVQELITQSTITEQRVQELIAQSSLTIDDTTANTTKVFSSQKVEELLTPKLEENQVKALITEEIQKLPQDSINEEQVRNLITEELAKSPGSSVDKETIKNIVRDILSVNSLKANVTFNGSGSPASNSSIVANANNGDTYLDTKTGEVYIKSNDTWQKINTDTTDLNGDGAPSSAGTLGQTYKDNVTGNIYVYISIDNQPQWKKLVNNVEVVSKTSTRVWTGEGSPKTSTTDNGMSEVKAGDVYHDTLSDTYYMCVNLTGVTLTWKVLSEEVKEVEYPQVESNAVFGEIGGLGAGIAYLPETAATVGLTPMSGASEVGNENFGNFIDSNNNVFVCIPMMYYKADTATRNSAFSNKPNIYISYVAKEGYAPFYAFKKSDGSYVPCVFVSKYLMGISGTKAISKKNEDTATSDQSYNGINKITGCQARNDNFFKAANSMNDNAVLHYAALRFVYYMVAEAHMQAAVRKFGSISNVPSFICAYLDKAPYFPKGCNNTLSDINDTSIRYTQGTQSYQNCGKTGSCNIPEKTTFNGQKCGIMDMGGLQWEVDAGYIVGEDNVTYILKGIDLLKSLNTDTYLNTKNYIGLNMANRRTTSAYRVGNGENPVFSFSDSGNDYNCDNFLNPLSTAMSSNGTAAYGEDYNYPLTKNYPPFFGGSYGHGAFCGLLSFHGSGYYWSGSNYYCSARTIVVPK